jgi:hypothetical protein
LKSFLLVVPYHWKCGGQRDRFLASLVEGQKGRRPMNSATILVVDDEPQVRRVLRATLVNNGFDDSELAVIRAEHCELSTSLNRISG